MAEVRRIKSVGVAARMTQGWPANPFMARRVRLTLQAYGGKWDAGAFDTLTRDALQGVLYHDDKIVSNGEQHPAYDDGRGRRLVIVADLYEIWSKEMAEQLEREANVRKLRSQQAKEKRVLGAPRAQLPLTHYQAQQVIGKHPNDRSLGRG